MDFRYFLIYLFFAVIGFYILLQLAVIFSLVASMFLRVIAYFLNKA